jgi:hypothetical protein
MRNPWGREGWSGRLEKRLSKHRDGEVINDRGGKDSIPGWRNGEEGRGRRARARMGSGMGMKGYPRREVEGGPRVGGRGET